MKEKTLKVQDIYVYVYLPGAIDPVLAGKMTSVGDRVTNQKKALFKYAESYFLRPNRIEIDPLRLPFKQSADHIYETDEKDGQEAFSVLYDSIPDAWGRARMLKHAGRDKMSTIEYILASGEDRSGFLAYGLDTRRAASLPPKSKSSPLTAKMFT